MKKLLAFFIWTCFSISSFGQHSYIDLSQVYAHAVRNKSIDSITYLLQLDSTLVNKYEKADLYSFRAKLMIAFNKKEIKRRTHSTHPILKEAYKDFSLAIQQIEYEKHKLKYVYRRFATLDRYKPKYKDYQSDLNLLSSKGYKNAVSGIGIIAITKYDGKFWFGGEISLFSAYRGSYKLIDDNNQVIAKRRTSVSLSALVFGYTGNIESSLNDFKFSLLRIEAPFL